MRMSLEDIFLSLTTEEDRRKPPAAARRWPMRNVLAIASKELQRLLRLADRLRAGRLLRTALRLVLLHAAAFFERQSMQMGMDGRRSR